MSPQSGPGEMQGDATITMTVSLATYERLAALMKAAPAEQVLARLLDRDPHDHAHRCPTCARRERLAVVPDPAQGDLFDERAAG